MTSLMSCLFPNLKTILSSNWFSEVNIECQVEKMRKIECHRRQITFRYLLWCNTSFVFYKCMYPFINCFPLWRVGSLFSLLTSYIDMLNMLRFTLSIKYFKKNVENVIKLDDDIVVKLGKYFSDTMHNFLIMLWIAT